MTKHMTTPSFDDVAIQAVRDGIIAAVQTQMESYSSPLRGLISAEVEKHSPTIARLIAEAVADLADGSEFHAEIKAQLRQKLARTIVKKGEGEYEKRLNELRSNPETRAKLTVAIAAALENL